mgnify:CR=1 FL=1
MENQHRKISGYRELSQEEIDLMNEVKAHGAALEATLKKIRAHLSAIPGPGSTDVYEASRWVSISATHLQQGLMAATRAVAKPDFF